MKNPDKASCKRKRKYLLILDAVRVKSLILIPLTSYFVAIDYATGVRKLPCL